MQKARNCIKLLLLLYFISPRGQSCLISVRLCRKSLICLLFFAVAVTQNQASAQLVKQGVENKQPSSSKQKSSQSQESASGEAKLNNTTKGITTNSTTTIARDKKFTFSTKMSLFARYGGVSVSKPTTLIGLADGEEDKLAALQESARKHNRKFYANPNLDESSIRIDLYELLLNFDVHAPLTANLDGGVYISFDALNIAKNLSGANWGGREVYPIQHFESEPLRKGSAYLKHRKWGTINLGITEGVAHLLDSGAQSIAAGRSGIFGEAAKTPWQVQRLGVTLGQAASENFPKIQYISPQFHGVKIGVEWFTNAQSSENELLSFSTPYGSTCPPTLFHTKNQTIGKPFVPSLTVENTSGDEVNPELFPDGFINNAKCSQLDAGATAWNANTSRFITGGNLAIAYEKSFKKNISFSTGANYGILSTEAKASEAPEELRAFYKVLKDNSATKATPEYQKSIYRAKSLEQAIGLNASISWKNYDFYAAATYLIPSKYKLSTLGGGNSNETGIEGLIWSIAAKAEREVNKKKNKKNGKKKNASLSISYAQALTKSPRVDNGSQQSNFLFNIGSNYPIGKGVTLVADYWYGSATLAVPFFITGYSRKPNGFTIYQQRTNLSHEVAIGIKMQF